MFLRHLTPMLATRNFTETIDFYTRVLGFQLQGTLESEGQTSWCSLRRDSVWLMFTGPLGADKIPQMTGDLYFYPSNVQDLWQEIKDKAEVICPLEETDYNMLEFVIKDNNGYVLRFGKELTPDAFERSFPPDFVLETDRVQLRILRAADVAELQKLTNSDTTWKYFTRDLSSEDAFKTWMSEALLDYAYQRRVPFVIIDKQRNAIAGSTSYGSISFFDKRIEVGWSWLGDAFKGSGVNTHAKFLLLRYALETLQWERVEIKTDNLNERSKAALHKIGATPEGVLRNHMQMHSNRRRDSIYFSVLKSEWQQVKEKLMTMIQ